MTVKDLATNLGELSLPLIADKDLTTPPTANTNYAYIVGPSATGDWEGHDGEVAFWDQLWRFLTPSEGWQIWMLDENAVYTYNGTSWALTGNRPPVTITAATTLTAIKHANRPLIVDNAAGFAITLPAATGSGNSYEFIIKTTVTSVGQTIKVANASDTMLGGVVAQDTDAAGTLKAWSVAAADDTITLSGTATGGKAGDRVRVTDVATNLFIVDGYIKQSGGSEATPFSATVS